MERSILSRRDAAASRLVAGPPVRIGPGLGQNGNRTEPCATPPQIEVIREGDVVRRIEITCSCGEVVHLACQYDGSLTSAGPNAGP